MSEQIADTTFLIGRKFMSTSGNICEIRMLGPGAIRAYWAIRPSQKDEVEVEDWAVALVAAEHGGEIRKTVCSNQKDEAAMYAKWKRDQA